MIDEIWNYVIRQIIIAKQRMGAIWVRHINNQQNRISLIRFCERNQYKTYPIRNRKKITVSEFRFIIF